MSPAPAPPGGMGPAPALAAPGGTAGPVLFARFAYPPNALEYCGPDDPAALLGHAGTGRDLPGLRHLAGQFAGAWPYLELIAAAARIRDPLDARVVEAYWIGNPLLERVGPRLLAAHVEDRFAGRLGLAWTELGALAAASGRPHHNFHVFAVYPWVGLLRAGVTGEPLRVLDACRIRWGAVLEVAGPLARVSSRPLTWDGHRLALGPPRVETARVSLDGLGLAAGVRPGSVVALHWDWVCEVLDRRRLARLRHYTATQIEAVNTAPGRPAPLLR